MKTAEELFEEYAIKYVTHDNPNDFIETTSFLAIEKFFFGQALADYKSSIIGLIDEMIKGYKYMEERYDSKNDNVMVVFYHAKVEVLTELKKKLREGE